MPLAIDINKEQQSLLWRRHLLTEVMKSRELHDLALEPVLNPVEAQDASVRIEKSSTSLKWEWSNWTRVDISTNHLDEATVVRTYAAFQPPEARWRELPIVSEIEVRFESENGTSACAKMTVPELTNFGRDVEFGLWMHGNVRIRLSQPVTAARVDIELLRPGQNGTFKRRGSLFQFPPGVMQIDVPVPDDFFGIIAVVARQADGQQLIAAADFNDYGEVIPQDVVSERLQQAVEGRYNLAPPPQQPTLEEWLRSWPRDSQRRLSALYDSVRKHFQARQLPCNDEYLRTHPTGLFRYLTLTQCGYESPDPRRLIRRLNDNSFQKALNSVLPPLGAVIAALRTPAEKIWAIQNAGNPNLQGAVNEAKNEGVAALKRALHLADTRSDAIAAWESRRRSSSASADSEQNP